MSLDTTTLCIYRLGVAELQFVPINMMVAEKVAINSDIDSSIYARTNAFVSYTNTMRTYNITFRYVNQLISNITFENNTGGGNINTVTEFINTFKSLMYANYDEKNDSTSTMFARTIKSPPMFKIKYSNFLRGSQEATDPNNPFFGKQSGLLGSITNLSVEPFYSLGYVPYSTNQEVDVSKANSANISYSDCKISFDFVPLFEKPLGWGSDASGGLKFSNTKQLGSIAVKTILGDN